MAFFYNKGLAVSPSDTVDFVNPPDAIYVGGAGIVVAVWPDGSTNNFTVAAGQLLPPLRMKRINATSTTATLMVALYSI